MKLYFNGCSHTYGDDLADPSTQAWPAIVANKIGCDFLNDAVSGGTNDRTVYRVIKNIDLYDKFYIAWTYTSRFINYDKNNNYEVAYNPALVNNLFNSRNDFIKYGELHYKLFYNELFNFKLWLQQIILLQLYLKNKSKKYIMINAAHNFIHRWTVEWQEFNNSVKSLLCFDLMNDDQLFAEYVEINKLVEQIDFTNFLGWGVFTIRGLSGHFSVGPTQHLLTEGHQAVANYILTNDPN